MSSILPSFKIDEQVCTVPGMTFKTSEIMDQPGILNKNLSPTVRTTLDLKRKTFDMK